MKHAAMLLVATAAMAAAQDDRQNPPPLPGWHPDLATGMKEAAATDKPLMVVFRCVP